MTNNYKTKDLNLLGRLCLFVMLLMASMGASAAGTVDGGEMELDKEYTNPKMTKTIYTFTAPKDGVLTITSTQLNSKGEAVANSDCPQVFSDEALQTRISKKAVTGTETASLVAGTKYYILAKWSMKEYKWKATMGSAELDITNISQEQGKAFDITGSTGLHITFNMAVKADDYATLTCGTQSFDRVEVSPLNNTLNLEPRDSISSWIQKGLIKTGDELTFKITGIHAASDENMKYGEDGTLTLKYLVPNIPTLKTGETLPSVFKSYWPKGDKDGIVVLEFDHNLLPTGKKGDDGKDLQTAVVTLGMGNIEGGPYYTETLSADNGKLTIDGNKLMVDLTDKLRTIESMGLDQNYGVMNLRVSYVKSYDGVNVYSPGQGNFGSFSYNISYKEVVNNMAYEFTPAPKSSLDGVKTIELYISDKTAVTFEGFNLHAGEMDLFMDQSMYTKEEDPDNGVVYKINIEPFAGYIDGATNVKLTLVNPVFSDGLPHDISAVYNYVATLEKGFAPVSVSPADQSVVEKLDEVKLTFGEKSVVNPATASTAAQFVDMTHRGTIVNAMLAVDGENDKLVHVTPETALSDTTSYRLVIAEGAIGNAEYETSGFTTGLVNEALTYRFVVNSKVASQPFITDPIDGATVSELSTILFKSNNNKEISPSWITNRHIYLKNAEGAYVAEAKPELGDDNYTVKAVFDKPFDVSGKYTLEVQDSVFIYGTGFDVDCNVLTNINYTIEGASDATVKYTFGAPVSTDPADQTEVEKLGNITLTFDKDVKTNGFRNVKVYNRENRAVVNSGHLEASAADSKQLVVVLDSALTTKGVYTVEINAGSYGDAAWADGNYLAGESNEAISYIFQVVGNKPVEPTGDVVTDPANGSTVKSLKTIVLTFTKNNDCAPSFNVQPQLLDANGQKVCDATADFGDDYNVLNVCKITLDEEVTAPGTYTLDIPAGVFILDNEDSPAMQFTYTVDPQTGISGVESDGAAAKVDVYTISGVRVLNNATNAELNKLGRGVYIVNGKKVVKK